MATTFPGMERWNGKTALVTGASAGIGYEISRQLAELGLNVIGCARNVEKIQVGGSVTQIVKYRKRRCLHAIQWLGRASSLCELNAVYLQLMVSHRVTFLKLHAGTFC